MIDLEALAVRRAAEQMATVDVAAEAHRHDPWAIKPTQYVGRPMRRKSNRRCWECGKGATRGGYCHKHYKLVLSGRAVDSDQIPTVREESRMVVLLQRLRSRVPAASASVEAPAPSPSSPGAAVDGGGSGGRAS